MSRRFDYVKYDKTAETMQLDAKVLVLHLEALVDRLPPGRAQSLAYTKLEECYMWIGKGIRDDQVGRGNAEPQEGRTNS